MKYIDLHCDALTCEGVPSVTEESLARGGCVLQCFAAFLREGEGHSRALALCGEFNAMCKRTGVRPYTGGELPAGINAMLTVEGGHALGGEADALPRLYARGVRMMTLTWNFENELGFPNFVLSPRRREKERGLKPFGREIVEAMVSLRMLPDVSHGSDRLVTDTAEICGLRGFPCVASHSGAAEVFPHARNLTDEGIRAIADCGGAVGLDACAAFLSDDLTPEGQREALLRHARHILRTGGEDVLSIGTDFDGAPSNPYLASPEDVPRFLEELSGAFGARIAEKIASGNALRVLSAL